MSVVSENIKQVREIMCLSMESFADRLGVTKQSVSNWENGKRVPSKKALDSITQLAEQNGLNINWSNHNPIEVTYKECLSCHYDKVETNFSFCPMCGESFIEINTKQAEEMLLTYFHVDRLIVLEEEKALYPFIDVNKTKTSITDSVITNKEEMKAINYVFKAKDIKYLKKLKRTVPLALNELSGLEKEIVNLLYCSSDMIKKSYIKVSKITGIDYTFIKNTDIKVRKIVYQYFMY